MRLLAHDYETTGIDPRTCGVVQSAIAIVDLDRHGHWEIVAQEVALHHPGCRIPDAASAVHGITDQAVAGLPLFEESLVETHAQAREAFAPDGVIGYNSNRFDNVIARRLGMPADLLELDMMVAANRLMTRGILTRARLVDAFEQLTGKTATNAHDAMADLVMTLELIRPTMHHLGFQTLHALVTWLATPEVDARMAMPFGKHRGTPLRDVPRGYLLWAQKNLDLQPDLALSIREVLG